MPCTQGVPLHFTESDDMQPNRKRSRETAHRLHDTVNRGMVQSIYADGRYFTHPTSVGFFVSDFKPFLPENPRESGMDVGFTVDEKTDIGKAVNGIAVNGKANANKYYLK